MWEGWFDDIARYVFKSDQYNEEAFTLRVWPNRTILMKFICGSFTSLLMGGLRRVSGRVLSMAVGRGWFLREGGIIMIRIGRNSPIPNGWMSLAMIPIFYLLHNKGILTLGLRWFILFLGFFLTQVFWMTFAWFTVSKGLNVRVWLFVDFCHCYRREQQTPLQAQYTL